MKIAELRTKIDKIDDTILELISERYKLAKKVGDIKQTKNSSVFVPEREKNILDRLSKKSTDALPSGTIQAVFREIMSGARFAEHPITIAFLKDDLLALFAIYLKFGSCTNLKPFSEKNELFLEVKNDINTYAVISSPYDPAPELSIMSEITINHPLEHGAKLHYLIIGKPIS